MHGRLRLCDTGLPYVAPVLYIYSLRDKALVREAHGQARDQMDTIYVRFSFCVSVLNALELLHSQCVPYSREPCRILDSRSVFFVLLLPSRCMYVLLHKGYVLHEEQSPRAWSFACV